MQKIGVVGAGTMGSGIAQVFAAGGFQVVLQDIDSQYLGRGLNQIEKNLNYAVSKGKITEGEREKVLERIDFVTELDALADSDLIIEAVTEDINIKKEVFRELDEICKEGAILASNTSALSITEIAAYTGRPEKVLGVHFFNPVVVMKLVELIRGITTSEETFIKIKSIIEVINKVPVETQESPGFVVNRLLIPMINEAIFILNEGIASIEEIDKAMKYGANHPLGPLALADLIGLDVCLAIMDTLFKEFNDSKYRACPLLRKKVRAGQLGRKTGAGFYSY